MRSKTSGCRSPPVDDATNPSTPPGRDEMESSCTGGWCKPRKNPSTEYTRRIPVLVRPSAYSDHKSDMKVTLEAAWAFYCFSLSVTIWLWAEIASVTTIHVVQPISLLHPVVNNALDGQRADQPPPAEVDGEEEYQVSCVEDSQVYRGQLQYRIHWTGYDSLTWEPAKFVDGLQAVGEFQQWNPNKPGPLVKVPGGPRT